MGWADGGAFFTEDDRLAIATALAQISKIILISGSVLTKLVHSFVDQVKAFLEATAEAEKEVEPQKELISSAEMSTNNALIDVIRFCRRVAVSGTGEVELLSRTLPASSAIARVTAKWCLV